MAEGLPQGLVSTNEAVTSDIQSFERIQVEDIKRLWQVYSANRATLPDNVGRRLENFFWRIWSNKRLLHTISGEQVAVQFSSINEGGYIRTTPRSSPRSSRSLGTYYSPATSTQHATTSSTPPTTKTPSSIVSHSPNEENASTPTQTSPIVRIDRPSPSKRTSATAETFIALEQNDEGPATPTPSSPFANLKKSGSEPKESRRSDSPRTKPILKKSNSGESKKSSKSAMLVIQPVDEQRIDDRSAEESAVASDEEAVSQNEVPAVANSPARRYTATRFSEQVAVSIPKAASSSGSQSTSRRNQGEGSQGSGKRNPIIVASTAASKRRPAVTRQRSSQTSQIKTSPSPPSPGIVRRSAGSTPITGQSPSTQSTRRARAASPHPSKDKRRVSTDVEPAGEKDASEGQKGKEKAAKNSFPLVESNFRSNFGDKTRPQHRSFTNLSMLDRKSSAVTATAASYQASGLLDFGHPSSWTGRGQGKDAFDHEIVPLKAPAPAGPEPVEEESPAPLPRTKSQLTLILERGKAGSQED